MLLRKKYDRDETYPYLKPSAFIMHIKGLASDLYSYNIHFNIKTCLEGQEVSECNKYKALGIIKEK